MRRRFEKFASKTRTSQVVLVTKGTRDIVRVSGILREQDYLFQKRELGTRNFRERSKYLARIVFENSLN